MPIIPAFRRASRLLAPDELKAIDAVLQRWQKETAIGRTVAPNLRDRENFLPRRYMVDLLRVILGAREEPVKELEGKYLQACYRFQRKGGRIRVSPRPEYLGRAVARNEFVKYLVAHGKPYITLESQAVDLVERLRSGQGLDPHDEEILLSKYTAWVTWNETNPAADPFGFVKHRLAVEVQAALGLDSRSQGPLLLLRYRRPADLELHRPTVADAGLFPMFDPPASTEKKHSRTRPWPYFPVKDPPPEFDEAPSCPEAVHGPVGLGVLTDSVEQLP